jgi:hypothetical protein
VPDFLANTVVPASVSAIAGVVAWIATNFFAAPLVEFRNLRKAVHESLFYNENVGDVSTDERINSATAELRRHAAALNALWVTAPLIVKKYLLWRRYNVESASSSLTGFSNSIHLQDGSRAIHRHRIQKGLRLPVDYTDVEMNGIIEENRRRMSGG